MTTTEEIYNGPDDLSKPMLTAYAGYVQEFKALQAELAAADGDEEKARQNWIENSDDPQAVKLRDQIDKLRAKLEELAEKNVTSVKLSDEEKEKKTTELNERREKVRAAVKTLRTIIDSGMSVDPEGVKTAIEKIGDPTRSGRGRAPGSEGSNLPRASVTGTVTGGNYENGEEFISFSDLAKKLNAEVKDLQIAFANAAGVEHQEISKVDKSVTFTFKPHPDGSEFTVVTQPKARKKPGPKKSDEAATTEATEAA